MIVLQISNPTITIDMKMILLFFVTLNNFEDYLNYKHQSIKFTSEVEKIRGYPFSTFLLIDRDNEKIFISIYRKPTFTGVYTHFYSFLPSSHKFDPLSTLLCRYFSLLFFYIWIFSSGKRVKAMTRQKN